jgi:hypothetical protein
MAEREIGCIAFWGRVVFRPFKSIGEVNLEKWRAAIVEKMVSKRTAKHGQRKKRLKTVKEWIDLAPPLLKQGVNEI